MMAFGLMAAASKFDSLPADAGLLLVGHGTRYAPGVDEFLNLAERVAARASGRAVEPCFLEIAAPSIAQGFARLVEQGVTSVVVAPVILFAAGHIRHDIPSEVVAAAREYCGVAVAQAPHLGCHPALAQLSSQRFAEALNLGPRVAPEDTALVMVGRGSRNAEATEEMLRFAQLRHATSPVGDTRTAFLAMADPPLGETLERLAEGPMKRVVVQPHLLFAGELIERVRSLVRDFAKRHAHVDWRVTQHLGPDELVATAILDRVHEAARLPVDGC